MLGPFHISAEALKAQGAVAIKMAAPCALLLDIQEPYLCYEGEVQVQGNCVLEEGGGAVLQLNIQAHALEPCTVCNEPTAVFIEIKNAYHFEKNPLSGNNDYDFTPLVRELILLETPQYVECNGGRCKMREEVKKYLKPEGNRRGSTS